MTSHVLALRIVRYAHRRWWVFQSVAWYQIALWFDDGVGCIAPRLAEEYRPAATLSASGREAQAYAAQALRIIEEERTLQSGPLRAANLAELERLWALIKALP